MYPEDRGPNRIAVVGLGYVGMSLAALLARTNTIVAVDIDAERVAQVNNGISPVLDPKISEYLESGNLDLRATTDPQEAFTDADYIVIATPTNYNPDKEYFDTSSVESVIAQVAEIRPSATIVIKSTVPVGFTARIQEQHPSLVILFSPEFLREGQALQDNLHPSRIIVSGARRESETFAEILASSALESDVPIIITGTTEAEAIKLFANTFLAMRVAFFNELDTFSITHGLDAGEIVAGVSLDPRIGNFYNNPSFGYGGYCLPKDTKQLLANYADIPQNLIHAIVEANSTRKDFIAEHILGTNPETVGIYRLAMKAGSDNFRSSAIQGVIRRIQDAGVSVVLFEPLITDSEFHGVRVIEDFAEFKEMSSIILTNRFNVELDDVRGKVFTRDIFGRD